jgi:asparagine synthase (glutamine-hydrolysing)
MCGIVGYVDLNDQIGDAAIKAMAGALNHRGPDAHGFFSYQNIHLAHTRLSIIDVKAASNQPFVSNCGNYVIVFNGEIYNYKELKLYHHLQCRTFSDTEVALELFIKHGPEHVQLLNGMFAYTILSIRDKKLFLFRDRFGVKPLFYFSKNGYFGFASEIKSLKQHPYIVKNLTLNNAAVVNYLHMGYIPEPHTIYNEIYKFSAGSWAVFDTKLIIHKYWSIAEKISKQVLSDETEAESQLESLLNSSISYRLIADVPVGVFLSGGVDSSLIAAITSKQQNTKIKSFTIGFKDSKFDESKHARKVAEYLGTEHHELILSEKDIYQNIDRIFEIYDEPFADQSMLPTLAVSQLASKYVKVALSGDGGDELFYGYGAYTWANRLSNPFLYSSRKMISKVLSLGNAKHNRVSELLNFSSENETMGHIHAKENGYFSRNEIHHLTTFNPELFMKNHDYNKTNRNLSNMEKQAIFDIEQYLKDDLLVKVDRASMYHSLEAREPLLDYRLAEFAININPRLKKNGNTGKYLLKKILYKHLPKSLMDRPKWGFTIPLNSWLNNNLSYLKDEYLNENIIKEYGIMNHTQVKTLLVNYPNKPYKTQQVWALILLHKWLKENM